MSLYWPEYRIALEIVDDPASPPFDATAHPDVTVIPITCAQLEDPDAFDEFARMLARRMGAAPAPIDPASVARRKALHQALFGTASHTSTQ